MSDRRPGDRGVGLRAREVSGVAWRCVVVLAVGNAAVWSVFRDAYGSVAAAVRGFAERAAGAGLACWWTIERVRRPRSPRVPRHVPDELVEDVEVDRQLGLAPPSSGRDRSGPGPTT